MNRTYCLIGNGLSFFTCKSCNSEVHDLYCSVREKHDILRLDVTMNYASVMRMLKRTEDLNDEMDSILPLQNTLLFDKLLKSNAVNIFHDDILHFVREAYVVYLYDIRMRKNSYSLGFIAESSDKFIIVSKFGFQDLDRNISVLNDVVSLVDISHSANADKLGYFVAAVQSFADIFIH